MKLRPLITALSIVVASISSFSTMAIANEKAGPKTEEDVVVVVVVAPKTVLDSDRVRAAIGRDLHATAVTPDDPRAANARGRLTVDARSSDSTLTVTYRKLQHGQNAGSSEAVVRSVSLPADQARAESSAVILATNVSRSEADDVLGGMQKKVSTTAPTTPARPPPTPAQVSALESLNESARAYERGAKDYRDTLAAIVKLHYETKKTTVLSGLDREITVEKKELRKAREVAIRRLEDLIATYAERRSQTTTPYGNEEVPDAMYRLAALYEERARDDGAGDVDAKHAIRLYKRIVREYPKYREIAGVHYFLGHALNDAGRVDEAQQVWRSLVCHDRFPYSATPDPNDPNGDADKDLVRGIPQDNAEAHWEAWRRRYVDAKNVSKLDAETVFVDPYPSTCVPLPSVKYVAEVWWQIGNWEFDQLDAGSGVTKRDPGSVWGYSRAASAYERSMAAASSAAASKQAAIYGVALYKHAWTLFKQQRYELATKDFVKLLVHTDEQQKLTGEPGADFRSEAVTYIAGSITNVDFKGPEEWEPFIVRPDPFSLASDDNKLRVSAATFMDRVKDPSVIPQDKSWTIDIYRALALELRSLGQFTSAIDIYETMLRRWPMDPSAPDTQNTIADAFDQLEIATTSWSEAERRRPSRGVWGGAPSRMSGKLERERDAIAQNALDARTKLASYTGKSSWVDANKDNPTALHNAERLVRTGLRRAAAQHTNNARSALSAKDVPRASAEYKLARTGWSAYLKTDGTDGNGNANANANVDVSVLPDAYESAYWLADASRNYVRTRMMLNETIAQADIDEAIAAAKVVRDGVHDDRYLDNAALFVVEMNDVERDLAYRRNPAERRDEVRLVVEKDGRESPVKEAIPPAVQKSIDARVEYMRIAPPSADRVSRRASYQLYIADTYFLYGDWSRARELFEAVWREHCGVDDAGVKAWSKLVTMAAKRRDEERALRLADAVDPKRGGKSCDPSGGNGETVLTTPLRREALYSKAKKKLEEACGTSHLDQCKEGGATADNRASWIAAAQLYEQALEAGPTDDDAPLAAMNGAFAWKRGGQLGRAIALYNKFIGEYGSSEQLEVLKNGDARAKVAPDPKRFADHVTRLGNAYDALASTYYAVFDYERTADTYAKLSRLDPVGAGAGRGSSSSANRRDAAKNAMILYASLGRRDAMAAAHRTFTHLDPSDEERADADLRIILFDYEKWDPRAPDAAANRQHRVDAERSLSEYWHLNHRVPGATRSLVRAAHAISRIKATTRAPDYKTWLANAVSAADRLGRDSAAKDANAAECAYRLIDEEITTTFDDPQRHAYASQRTTDVLAKYRRNAEDAKRLSLRLQKEVIDKYTTAEWVVLAVARQGAIFDTLRTGLYNTTNPKLFDAKGEQLLESLRRAGQGTRADELEDVAKDAWSRRKQREIDDADELIVDRYASAVANARKYDVKSGMVTKALGRLVHFTDVMGAAKMKQLVEKTPDPMSTTPTAPTRLVYSENMYARSVPGLQIMMDSGPLKSSQTDPKPLPLIP